MTVPAGAYSATVVDESVADTAAGISGHDRGQYLAGAGRRPVPTVVLASSLGAMHSTAADALESVTKG